VSKQILDLLPLPTNGDLINNYVIPGYSTFNHTTVPSFKIDHNIDAKNKLSFFFSYNRQRSPGLNGFTQVWSTAAQTLNNSYTYRLNYDRTVSPTQVLHLGAGLVRTYQQASIPNAEFKQEYAGLEEQFSMSINSPISAESEMPPSGASEWEPPQSTSGRASQR
jgi:hypothetical protein